MTFGDILVHLIRENQVQGNPPLGKTRLLKLAYLVELIHYRRFRRRLLDTKWIYYLYGPWTREYDPTLQKYPFELDSKSSGEWQEITADPDYVPKETQSLDEKTTIYGVVVDFAKMPMADLLDYVYFETEPMVNVGDRGQRLDFSSVLDAERFRVQKLDISSKERKKLQDKYREKAKGVRRI